MRIVKTLLALIVIGLMIYSINAQTPQELSDIWDKQHISTMPASQVRHADLKKYLDQLKQAGLPVTQIGFSFESRDIYMSEWGKGPMKILMWSQMHGDEPTATSALMDMFHFLQKNRELKWVADLEKSVTIRIIPMLNPDGTEKFQRRNAQSIDVNRDAQDLATPEGRLLKKVRDEWQPEIGFNLHNQNSLTAAGRTNRQATMSFLAVLGNAENKVSPASDRSRRLCVVMMNSVWKYLSGHIGRYDDTYNPLAFGDRMSEWGTATVLVETGARHGKDEMFLIKMNFIAYLSVLNSLATGSEKNVSMDTYALIPENRSGHLFNFMFRGADVVDRNTGRSVKGDVAVNASRRRAGEEAPHSVQQFGDLNKFFGLDEVDVSNYYLAPINMSPIAPGSPAGFLFYKKDRAQNLDWTSIDLQIKSPPDGIFDKGKWVKPLK